MRKRRVILGGFVAGIVMNVIDAIANSVLLAGRYRQLQESGHLLADPRQPFLPIWILSIFFIGFILAFLYASVRPRLGPGAKTAALIGLAVGFVWAFPSNFATASWIPLGRFLPFVWSISSVIESLAGALVAGALYQEIS